MNKPLKYFSVHDKILYQDACHRPIDLNKGSRVFLKENYRVHDTKKVKDICR